jgi:NADPH:quinone reductase-like Zn-dependent oxidoreductase
MKAVVGLELREVEKPSPGDDEVLIEVRAVSINDWDWELLRGNSFFNRFFKPRGNIVGSDVAGRIEAAGKNVTLFKPGDEVYGDLSGRWGGFAEYVCARETELAPKPPGMTFVQAAAIPQAAMLAHQGLRDLRPGQTLLINGAGGGVGTFAVQLAKVLPGVEVTGVDSAAKLDMMRAIGFDRVVDYTKDDVTTRGELYDLILDVKTSRSVRDFLRILRPGGTYATVGGSMRRLSEPCS